MTILNEPIYVDYSVYYATGFMPLDFESDDGLTYY